jgi:phytoene synthase
MPALSFDAAAPGAPAAADLRQCRVMLRENSWTFFAASLLLPREVRESASAIYAFCRLADDAVDLGEASGATTALLRARVARLCRGDPADDAADRALAHVVRREDMPQTLLDALIEGFEWDAAARQYEDFDALCSYAARVAGTVGAMMALAMGARAVHVLARACDLGVAMQLSNIARDVAEDARRGRLYLPHDWLREQGIAPQAWLAAPRFDARLFGAVRRLVEAAEVLYDRAAQGLACLPAGCQPGIAAARLLYREIGREVVRRGPAGLAERAVVPAARKAVLLTQALAARIEPQPLLLHAPPLAATRFLVDAACRSRPPVGAGGAAAAWSVQQRAEWVIGLFERLERRDRDARATHRGWQGAAWPDSADA